MKIDIAKAFPVLTVIVGIPVYAFTTFATMRYVDDKHAEGINRIDVMGAIHASRMDEITSELKSINQKLWEIKEYQFKGESNGRD